MRRAWRRRLGIALLAVCAARTELFGSGEAEDRGRALYLEHCARCHGAEARGDGRDAASFDAPAADLRAPALWSGNSDEALLQRLREGREHRLKPSRVQDLPVRTPRTDALVAYLRRLPSVDWARVDAGRRVYAQRCAACHGWYGEGGAEPAVKPLAGLDGGRGALPIDDRRLARLARHDGPGQPPPPAPIGEEESLAVARFLRLLSPGYELYERYCAVCHGPHGATSWLAFDRAYFRKMGRDELRERVWHMLRGAQPTMPHFRDTLPAADLRAILAHLRSLPPPAD